MEKSRQSHHSGGDGIHRIEFHLPFQILLGIIFMAFGAIYLLIKFNNLFFPYIPENIIDLICAIGSVIGGFYLVMSKIYKPRIYL